MVPQVEVPQVEVPQVEVPQVEVPLVDGCHIVCLEVEAELVVYTVFRLVEACSESSYLYTAVQLSAAVVLLVFVVSTVDGKEDRSADELVVLLVVAGKEDKVADELVVPVAVADKEDKLTAVPAEAVDIAQAQDNYSSMEELLVVQVEEEVVDGFLVDTQPILDMDRMDIDLPVVAVEEDSAVHTVEEGNAAENLLAV
jgi:hypothetical protein